MRIILFLDATQCSLVEIYKCFGGCSAKTFADLYYNTMDCCVVRRFSVYCECVYPSKHATRITMASEKLPHATGVQQLK
jgi:hypothetical protein